MNPEAEPAEYRPARMVCIGASSGPPIEIWPVVCPLMNACACVPNAETSSWFA
jgi:hypothetical protein